MSDSWMYETILLLDVISIKNFIIRCHFNKIFSKWTITIIIQRISKIIKIIRITRNLHNRIKVFSNFAKCMKIIFNKLKKFRKTCGIMKIFRLQSYEFSWKKECPFEGCFMTSSMKSTKLVDSTTSIASTELISSLIKSSESTVSME